MWRSRAADQLQLRVFRPLLQLIFVVDERPHRGDTALYLRLRSNEPSRHGDTSAARRIARSMFEYAPQRQRLPAIAARISPREGDGDFANSAVAETIWPGVQNPHWRAPSS